MRENEKKQALVLQASQNFNNKKVQNFKNVTSSPISDISSHAAYTNYQINKSKKLLHRDNLGRNKKERQKVKKNGR